MLIFGNFSAYAEVRILKGIKISGDIGDSAYFNSNPGFAPISQQGKDWGNLTNLNLNLAVPFKELHRYSISTSSNWVQYFEKQKYTQFNTRLAQSLDFVFNNAALNLHHTFEDSSDPSIKDSVFISNGILKKNVNDLGGALKANLGKLKAEGGCNVEMYRTNDLYKTLERNTYTPYLEGAFEITPLLDGYTRYTYERTERRDHSMDNSDAHAIAVGLRGELSRYLVGEIYGGYSIMNFDQKFVGSDTSGYSGAIFGGSLANRLFKNTSQKIVFSYEPEVGYNVGNYYKSYTVSYMATHKLNRFMNLNGLFEYENSRESGGSEFKEKIDSFRAGAGVDYLIAKNTSLRADYRYWEKDSSRHGKSYKQHTVTAGLNYTF